MNGQFSARGALALLAGLCMVAAGPADAGPIVETQRLLPASGSFSNQVEFAGDYLLVATENAAPGSDGIAVYRKGNTGWMLQYQITAPPLLAEREFARSMGAQGVVLAAVCVDPNRVPRILVYRRAGNEYRAEAILFVPGIEPGRRLGSIAVHGDRIAVNALARDYTGRTVARPAIHVFVRENDAWRHEDRLFAPGATAGFGTLDMTGDLIAAGASGDIEGYGMRRGAAYLFHRNSTGNWKFLQRFQPADGTAAMDFGRTLALQDRRLVVGAPYSYLGGAVYVFEPGADGPWVQTARLTEGRPFEYAGLPTDGMGISVDASGPFIVAGRPRYAYSPGLAVVFKQVQGQWRRSQVLDQAYPNVDYENFGHVVAMQGRDFAVMRTDRYRRSELWLYEYQRP